VDRKPEHASGYSQEGTIHILRACLYVATKLGDLIDDLVIVGGLVPSLIVDQAALPAGAEAHVGTLDLDVGLQVGLLDLGRYKTLSERLRDAKFSMAEKKNGKRQRQRWALEGFRDSALIDFLIPPTRETDHPGTLRDLESDFAAIIAPGLDCAFRDRVQVTLDDVTIFGAKAKRAVWVCGAGGYVVLKALAWKYRGENKDAYDLFYVVRNYGSGVEDVAVRLKALASDAAAQEALEILRRDFLDPASVGPHAVAQFLFNRPDVDLQTDVAGFIALLLERIAQ
jgi:hypothetical protein